MSSTNTFLSLLLHPDSPAPKDPATGKPIKDGKARIEFLKQTLEQTKEKILLPTPALAEFLVVTGKAGPEYLAELGISANFEIVPFDQIAAIELAISLAGAKASGDKKSGSSSTWAKVKFDAQIVAIAKVRGADVIYSDDEDVEKLARKVNIKVIKVLDLPSPPTQQPNLFTASEQVNEESERKDKEEG